MNDVAIIGVGLHPFGRFGDKTAFEMGADAVDAGPGRRRGRVEGRRLCVRRELGGRPDRPAHRPPRPHRHPVHERVQRLCHRGRHDPAGRQRHRRGRRRRRRGRRHGQARRGARSRPTPTLTNVPAWYGDNGQFVTTKFFGMKINRYMHDHGISTETLARVAAKNYRNGVLNPNAFRRTADRPRRTSSPSPMLNYPLTQYMFCAPGRGGRGRRAVPGRHRPPLHRHPRLREGDGDPHPQLRRLRGQHHLGRRSTRTSPPPSTRRGPPTRRPGSVPRTST